MACRVQSSVLAASCAAVVLGFLSGCGSPSTGGAGGTQTAIIKTPTAAGGYGQGGASAGVSSGGATNAEATDFSTGQRVEAPADAAFTIFCREFTDARHYDTAIAYKKAAEQASKLTDFYVVRGDGRSVLYHGFYRSNDETIDQKSADQLRADRQLIERIAANGQKVFPQAVVASLDRADPKAPEEWNLANADGYWTVVIGVYTDPLRRKKAAVDSVRQARDMGVEAYFLHTEGQSYICIGTWPREAVAEGVNPGDQRHAAAMGIDEYNPPPIIISNEPLNNNDKARIAEMERRTGQRIRVFHTQAKIDDPSLQKVVDTYPYSVDGFDENKPPLLLNMSQQFNRTDDRPAATKVEDKTINNVVERPF